jgi:signal transduction histidine kinase
MNRTLKGSLTLFFLLTIPILKAQTSLQDSSKVYWYIELGDQKNTKNAIDSAEFYYQMAGDLAEKIGFHKGYLEYTGHYTGFLYRQARYQDALKVAEKQLEVSQRTKDQTRTANAYNNMALQYQAMGNMQEAAKSLMKALDISLISRDQANQQKYYTNLGSLFIDLKDYKKAVHYAGKGHELAISLNDTFKIGRSLVNLMVAEILDEQLELAEKHAKEAILIGEKYQNNDLIMSAYCNLGDIYLRKKDYKTGLETLLKSLALLPDSPPDYQAYVYQGIANAYKHLGQYKEANQYFSKAITPGHDYLPRAEYSALLLSGSEIKEALGDYKEALNLRKQYEILNHSLLNESTQKTLHDLEIQYQTAEKELKLAQQQMEIERRNKWIIYASILVAVLIGLLFLIQKMNRQKRKTMETLHRSNLLEAQLAGEEEERSRTARELHDGVASVLSAAKLHLQPNTPIYSLVDHALQEVRDISHNMAAEVVGSEGLSYAVREFCQRVSHPLLNIEYIQVGELPKMNKGDELLLYRSIQEAVTNIVKHAQASEALVQIASDGERLTVTIEDNGVGFDPDQLKKPGIGLKSLASRIHLLDGTYEVVSDPGKGTSIYIECNFEKDSIPA